MCLITGNKIALVAEKDITVYKELEICYVLSPSNFKWQTPWTYTPVELNQTMYPNSLENIHSEKDGKYAIYGGAIHAHIMINGVTQRVFSSFSRYFKAIIKAGTTYYVHDDFKQIAAKELFITDQIIEKDFQDALTTPDMNQIYRDYLKATFNNPEYCNSEGVFVGFFKLSDGTYANPLEEFNHDKAIGIVGFIHNDTPVVASLTPKLLPWLTDTYIDYEAQSSTTIDNYKKDMEGKKHTFDISHLKEYDPTKFKAIDYCLKYKTDNTEEGDWYLGSIGEMIKLAQNVGIINSAIKYTGVGKTIRLKKNWTSSELEFDDGPYTYQCDMLYGDYSYLKNCKECNKYVRPLTKKIN